MGKPMDPSSSDIDPHGFSFRRVTQGDLTLLHGWLNEPGVVRWWEGDDVSWEAVVADHVDAETDTYERWLATVATEPVGWLACGPADEVAEEFAPWAALGIRRGAAGIDYLVGDPTERRRGLGSAMIAAFVDQVVFGLHPEWTQAAADPMVANEASWRALAKAGFHHIGDYDDVLGACRLMALDRPPPR